jgi:hypothetical protein
MKVTLLLMRSKSDPVLLMLLLLPEWLLLYRESIQTIDGAPVAGRAAVVLV